MSDSDKQGKIAPCYKCDSNQFSREYEKKSVKS